MTDRSGRLRWWLTYDKRDAVSRSSQLRAGIEPLTINLLGAAGGGPVRRRPTAYWDVSRRGNTLTTTLRPPPTSSSHGWSGVEVAISTAAVTLLVTLTLVVDNQAPLVELKHTPQRLRNGTQC